jgi:hypothetical protein
MDTRVRLGAISGAFIAAILLIPAGFPLWMTVLLHSDPSTSDAALFGRGLSAFCLLLGIGSVFGAVVGGLAAKWIHSPLLPKDRFHSSLILFVALVTLAGLELGFLVSPVSLIGVGSTATSIDMWGFSLCVGSLAFLIALFLAVLALAGGLVVKAATSSSKMPGPHP